MCYKMKDDDYSCLSKCERFFSPDPIHSRSCFCVRPLPHNTEWSIQFRRRDLKHRKCRTASERGIPVSKAGAFAEEQGLLY